jgi:hypothetical protein
MWIPFRTEINEIFESDRHLLLKLCVGVGVGLCVGLRFAYYSTIYDELRHPLVQLVIVAICIVVSIVFVGLLGARDCVHKRIADRRPVSVVLRLIGSNAAVVLMLFMVAFTIVVGIIISVEIQ